MADFLFKSIFGESLLGFALLGFSLMKTKLSFFSELKESNQNRPLEKVETEVKSDPTFPHLLLYGPPGTGKTALARVLANELARFYRYRPRFWEMPALAFKEKKALDLLIYNLKPGDVVFIDEAHRLPKIIEEAFYSIIQDNKYSNIHGVIPIPPFTLIAATTKAGALTKAFRDRFVIELELVPANKENLVKILEDQEKGIKAPLSFEDYHGQQKAKTLLKIHLSALTGPDYNLEIGADMKELLAQRSLANPRVLKQLYKHIIAYAKAFGELDMSMARQCMDLLGIDEFGLHTSDRRIIRVLLDRNNTPAGLSTLSVVADVSKEDLEHVIEARLIYSGFLERTPNGRALTAKALELFSGKNEEIALLNLGL